MTRALSNQCPACGLGDDSITDGIFQCFDVSPQTVTYRAAIHGTEGRTSSQLRDEIRTLVARGASIPVQRVSMSFVAACSVDIGSLNDPRCSSPTTQLPIVPIIVGGALGAVIAVMVCGILLVVCVVCCGFT